MDRTESLGTWLIVTNPEELNGGHYSYEVNGYAVVIKEDELSNFLVVGFLLQFLSYLRGTSIPKHSSII